MINNRRSSSRQVKVILSANEASYVQGVLAAYEQSLELSSDSDSDLIEKEKREAKRLEKKFAPV